MAVSVTETSKAAHEHREYQNEHGQPTHVGSESDLEKTKAEISCIRVDDEDDKVTVKTWMVVMVHCSDMLGPGMLLTG